jgi:hypothetical protein
MTSVTGRDRFEVDPPPDAAARPPARFTLPRGAVDCHAHVIGNSYIAERSYTPSPAPPDKYLRMLDATGMDFGVLVQVSVHGTDNSLMLDTLKANPQRLRGVAVTPAEQTDAAWRALKEAGVTGLRLNTRTGRRRSGPDTPATGARRRLGQAERRLSPVASGATLARRHALCPRTGAGCTDALCVGLRLAARELSRPDAQHRRPAGPAGRLRAR